jgi:hypothetical protein
VTGYGPGKSFHLAEVLSGRHLQHDGPMALEMRDGDTWTEIARYGSGAEAAEALDEQMADGVDADRLRLTPLHRLG